MTGLGGVSITNNGGGAFSHPTFPVTFDVKGSALNDTETPSGDPILAADPNGNIWAGGLSLCTPGPRATSSSTASRDPRIPTSR